MNKQKLHGFCIMLMLLAMFVRLAGQVQAYLQFQEQSAPKLWRVDVESPVPVPLVHKTTVPVLLDKSPAPEVQEEPNAAEIQETPPDELSEASDVKAPEPLTFSPEEADSISIAGGCTYTVDKQALLLQPSTLDFAGEGPKVLIVHTHASEAYTPEPGYEYEPSDTLRTEDPERSVIRIGSEIARILEDNGIETLHDTTLNDYPNYDGSYARMQSIIESYLTQYPSIQIVLDVHRDAAEDRSGFPAALTAVVGGEDCARLMLVVGTDEGGLTHPNWQENLANALKLQALLNRSAPGLCRDLDLRTERFNQHETIGSFLCEFGASGNTLSQALRAARIFADALTALVYGVSADS